MENVVSLSDLGNLGEFISSIAVVVTLIYIAIQVKQNSYTLEESAKLVRAQSRQASTQLQVGFQDLVLTDSNIRDIYTRFAAGEDLSDLSPEDIKLLEGITIRSMYIFSDDHYRYQLGLLDESEWHESLLLLRAIFIQSADFRLWW